jgi:hypothetical protein
MTRGENKDGGDDNDRGRQRRRKGETTKGDDSDGEVGRRQRETTACHWTAHRTVSAHGRRPV